MHRPSATQEDGYDLTGRASDDHQVFLVEIPNFTQVYLPPSGIDAKGRQGGAPFVHPGLIWWNEVEMKLETPAQATPESVTFPEFLPGIGSAFTSGSPLFLRFSASPYGRRHVARGYTLLGSPRYKHWNHHIAICLGDLAGIPVVDPQ